MKFFTQDTLLNALDGLREADGKWALVGLVLALNGVTSEEVVNINLRKGSDRALDDFVAGSQIGLQPKQPGGKVNLRPMFKDLATVDTKDQRMNVDYSKLWSSTLSQSGYAAMRDNETLMRTTGSDHQLGPKFTENFQSKLGAEFKFENFLIWLFAFRGIPDEINDWGGLRQYFEDEFSESGIPTEFEPPFGLSGEVPWPQEFLSDRPLNLEFQELLTPDLAAVAMTGDEWVGLRSTLATILESSFDGYSASRIDELTRSIISALRGSRRLFLFGEPGTGKSQIARMVISAFEQVFSDRIHAVFVAVSDSTSADKLIGFSTLDGRWIDGELTREDGTAAKRRLLYPESDSAMHRRQINVLVLDEANRRDIEELLAKLQLALDSSEVSPDSAAYRIGLDNSGEQIISPNTFLIMTGNSPRDDTGRLTQSRPFKRRQNLVVVENVFSAALASPEALTSSLVELWKRVSTTTESMKFGEDLASLHNQPFIESLRAILNVLANHEIGVSYGLVEKFLRTSAARLELGDHYGASIDFGFTESVFPLLATDSNMSDDVTLRQALDAVAASHEPQFPTFFRMVAEVLELPDSLGRVRAFL